MRSYQSKNRLCYFCADPKCSPLLLSRRTVAGERRAMHDALVFPRVPGPTAMQAMAIIPHDEVVRSPPVAIDEGWLRRPLQQFRQQGAPPLRRPPDDV